MSGNLSGGRRAAQTNRLRHGADFYHRLGKKAAATYAERQRLGLAKPRGFAYAAIHYERSDPRHPAQIGKRAQLKIKEER